MEMSDVPKTMISPATCIPQEDAGNISKENDGPNYGKELDSHHCLGSCSTQGIFFFFPLLKHLADQRQFLKIIFTVSLSQKLGNSRFTTIYIHVYKAAK